MPRADEIRPIAPRDVRALPDAAAPRARRLQFAKHADRRFHGAQTGRTSEGARQGADDASRRVRSRRDPPHPRGKARRAVAEAGDRDRALEGAARGRTSAAAATWDDVRADAQACRARRCARARGAVEEARIGASSSRDSPGARARRSWCGVARGARDADARGRETTRTRRPFTRRAEGGPNEGSREAARGGEEGRAYASDDARQVEHHGGAVVELAVNGDRPAALGRESLRRR